MAKLTKIEALKACYRIWKKIYEQDLTCKPDATIFEKRKYIHNCPCCQYVKDNFTNKIHLDFLDQCNHCPLFELWDITRVDKSKSRGACEVEGSCYITWIDNKDSLNPRYQEIARLAAKKIMDASKSKYEKLEAEDAGTNSK